MIICSCKGITDHTVRAAIAGGARTLDDLAKACGAGSKCGGCHPLLAAMLAAPEAEPIKLAALLRMRPRRCAPCACPSAPAAVRSGNSSSATVPGPDVAGEAA